MGEEIVCPRRSTVVIEMDPHGPVPAELTPEKSILIGDRLCHIDKIPLLLLANLTHSLIECLNGPIV